MREWFASERLLPRLARVKHPGFAEELKSRRLPATLGCKVEKFTPNSCTVSKGASHITVQRSKVGEKFQTVAHSYKFHEQIAIPLVMEYAKVNVKKYFKSKGYTMSQGKKANQYVLTTYK